MAKQFVISDENVLNDRGFRVMTSGIRLERFSKNPICLFMHSRPSRWDLKSDSVLAIGTWENLKVENGQLIGTPVFDEGDEFAKRIMDKVEKGIYRMCSPGLEPITTSSDAQYLLPGQRYETVVDSELIEISIADIGSNPNSLALYRVDEKNELVCLSAENITLAVPVLAPEEPQTQNVFNMKKIALALGMSENATEDEMVARIKEQQTAAETLKSQLGQITLSSITKIVEAGIAEKRFTADKRDEMINLGKTVGADQLQSVISLMSPATKPTEHIERTAGESGGGEGIISLSKLIEKRDIAGIELFKKTDPDGYASQYKVVYGTDYIPQAED